MSFPSNKRRIIMHPAHRTIGILADRYGAHRSDPWNGAELGTQDATRLNIAPIRVALVADRQNFEACRAQALFEQAIDSYRRAEWHCWQFSNCTHSSDELGTADGFVLFERGLHIVSGAMNRGPGQMVAALSSPQPVAVTVEVAATAPKHPILDGVDSFPAHRHPIHSEAGPCSGTVLLVGRTATEVHPVAWAYEGRQARIFSTLLGCPRDFSQESFTRLLYNALKWAV